MQFSRTSNVNIATWPYGWHVVVGCRLTAVIAPAHTHTNTQRETSTLSTVGVDTSPETNIYFLIASTFYFRPAHVIIDSGHQLAAEKTYAIRRNQTQPPTRQSVGKEV